jgi:hypothetical protein
VDKAFEVFKTLYDVDETSGCWIWKGSTTTRGYGQFYSGKMHVAHRFSYEHYKGQIPEGLIIRHVVCDNPLCVNPDHLEPGTHQDNSDDKVAKGRQATGEKITAGRSPIKGEANGRSVLSELEVEEMKQIHEIDPSISQRALAEFFGISKSQVGAILRGERWNG